MNEKKNKTCKSCLELKPTTEYYIYTSGIRYGECKSCYDKNLTEADKLRALEKAAYKDKLAHITKNAKPLPENVLALLSQHKAYKHIFENFSMVPFLAKYVSLQMERLEYKVISYLDGEVLESYEVE